MRDVTQNVSLLKESGYEREFMFVDTPGSMATTIRNAVLAADCVVMPNGSSKVDWLAQEGVADMVDERGARKGIPRLWVGGIEARRTLVIGNGLDDIGAARQNSQVARALSRRLAPFRRRPLDLGQRLRIGADRLAACGLAARHVARGN